MRDTIPGRHPGHRSAVRGRIHDVQRRREDRAPEARVAVLGASGYSGQEFVRLALGHPGLELAALCSREHAGRSAAKLLPGLDPRAGAMPAVVDPGELDALLDDGAFDTLVACLPHGAWQTLAAEHPALASGPARVVDLSSDHRDGAAGYVYGLPEAFRAGIAEATRIANPGCYPTAATLALLPALERGWLAGPVMVTALSGVSGAGRAPALRTSFVELDGGAAIYRAGEAHAHVPEMARNFARLAGHEVPVAFVPQLAPMARGILLTAIAPLARRPRPRRRTRRTPSATRTRRSCGCCPGRVARDARGEVVEPLRRRGDHRARRPHAARDRGDRQPGQGRRGPGAAEPEPAARLARGLGPARAREPVVRSAESRIVSAAVEVRGNRRATAVAGPTRTPQDAPRATGSPVVVKLGGRALEAPGAHEELAAAVAGSPVRASSSTAAAPR